MITLLILTHLLNFNLIVIFEILERSPKVLIVNNNVSDQPLRMNGKVSGLVNDIKIDSVDLHAYIVTEEGRSYTGLKNFYLLSIN